MMFAQSLITKYALLLCIVTPVSGSAAAIAAGFSSLRSLIVLVSNIFVSKFILIT